ncbi:MAG: TonB-dependent receptor [Bacteroidales bacterium]|nr:TonB-dependent receptor [Bacteroidales bacterium]
MRLSRLIMTFILAVCSLAAYGKDFRLSGTVIDKAGGAPVAMSTILLRENGLWALSDDKGHFEIAGIPAGEYTVEISELGYVPYTRKIEIRKDIAGLVISLEQASLSLDEVVVTAKEGGGLTSASRISKQALEHIQPSSLKDVMQLLPGSITQNPDMTTAAALSIRDIGSNSANALGTALIVDGATLSNDANMQVFASGTNTNSGSSNAVSSAGGGVDARQLSTDNIESIQVIRGIPSVVYGDMTSGAVVVKTKAGVSPWEVRLKADPQLKQVSAGKGFSLGQKAGMMNFDLDYARAFSDVRTPSSAYSRANFQIGYFNNFARKLTFNAKLRGNWSNATNASDPDLFLDELSQEREKGLRLNINGRWLVNRKWLTNVEYLVSGSIMEQYSRQRDYQGSAGYTATTTELQDTENMGFFTKPQYYSDVQVFGMPVDAQARISAHQTGNYGHVRNKVLAGAEWKMDGNSGRGKVFDPYCPPQPGSAQAFRERSYRDIPYMHRITAFAEDNLLVPIGKTSVELQAGARFSTVRADGINTSAFNCMEPRFNGKYMFVSNKPKIKELSARAGWGLAYKMPSMVYLYPEPAYKDMVSFSYNDFDANNKGLNILTTKKMDTVNPGLRPQRSANFEAAVEFDTRWVSGSVVYYDENMTDGYTFMTSYVPMEYRRYGYSWSGGNVVQTVLPSGKDPKYDHSASRVTVDGKPLSSIVDTTFMSLSMPANGVSNHKKGVEFTLDFPQIKPLATSVSVSGAYMNMSTLQSIPVHRLYSGSVGGRTYPYIGIYAGSTTSSNASVRERFSTNFRFITHIPRIAMVVTMTAQMVFMDRTRHSAVYNGLSLPYFYDENGTRISGEEAMADTRHTKFINPLYVMDRSGRIYDFTQEMELDSKYRNLLITTNTTTYYLRGGYPFYAMLNLRLTKEIGKVATVSFYANNFLNMRGRVNHSVTGYPNDRNTAIYFGAEAKFSIR